MSTQLDRFCFRRGQYLFRFLQEASAPFVPRTIDELDLACLLVGRSSGPWHYRKAVLDLASTRTLDEVVVVEFGAVIDLVAERERISINARSARALRLLKSVQIGGSRPKRNQPRTHGAKLASGKRGPKKLDQADSKASGKNFDEADEAAAMDDLAEVTLELRGIVSLNCESGCTEGGNSIESSLKTFLGLILTWSWSRNGRSLVLLYSSAAVHTLRSRSIVPIV